MYYIVKALGYIVRWFICAITIDKINVTKSFFLSYFIISPIISELLWKLSRYTCRKIVFQELDINNSTIRSLGYTIAYIIYTVITFIILIVLKMLEIIPFANNFDERIINWISKYFSNKITEFSNKIVKVLQSNIQ